MRLIGIFLFLAVVLMVPFLLWENVFTEMFGDASALDRYGSWAWAVGIGLLVIDVFLPIPGTAVMAGLGYLYGTFLGGVVGSVGSILAGLLAYGLCRGFGRGFARWVAGERDLEKGERLFAKAGGWIVALSRWLPLLPEVIACMAGIARMPFARFSAALACGSVPLAFAFAAVGKAGTEHPVVATLLSILAPPALWLVIGPILRKEMGGKGRQ